MINDESSPPETEQPPRLSQLRKQARKSKAPRITRDDLLTPQEIKLVHHFLDCGNVTLSAQKAGYKESTAKRGAYKIFQRPRVQAYLKECKSRYIEKGAVTLERVVNDLGRLAQKAEISGKYSDAIRAIQLMGETIGAFAKSQEHKHHHLVSESTDTSDAARDIQRLLKAVNAKKTNSANISKDSGNA